LQSWGIRTTGAWLEKFRRYEVAIGAIEQRREGTVFALKQGREEAWRRVPWSHPLSRHPAHAADLAPCQQAHAIHLVRRLSVHYSPTLRDVQLIRAPGAQHPVSSAPGGHGAQPA